MATLTASGAQATVQPKGLRVGLTAIRSSYVLDVSLSAGDVLQMIKVPANTTPIFIQYGTSSPSAHLLFEIGDGIVAGRYRSMATYSLAQGMLVSSINVSPYTYSQEDTIDVVISLATVASPGGSFFMNAIFSMDPGT